VSALPASTIDGAYQIITASANGALGTIDGFGGAITKLLVMFEADQKKNGKYDVIAQGSGSTPWQLRRSTDFDATNKIRAGMVRVLNGTANGGRVFKQDTPAPVIGTSNIVFSEFGVPGSTIDVDEHELAFVAGSLFLTR
jgi:hypothetical protein